MTDDDQTKAPSTSSSAFSSTSSHHHHRFSQLPSPQTNPFEASPVYRMRSPSIGADGLNKRSGPSQPFVVSSPNHTCSGKQSTSPKYEERLITTDSYHVQASSLRARPRSRDTNRDKGPRSKAGETNDGGRAGYDMRNPLPQRLSALLKALSGFIQLSLYLASGRSPNFFLRSAILQPNLHVLSSLGWASLSS